MRGRTIAVTAGAVVLAAAVVALREQAPPPAAPVENVADGVDLGDGGVPARTAEAGWRTVVPATPAFDVIPGPRHVAYVRTAAGMTTFTVAPREVAGGPVVQHRMEATSPWSAAFTGDSFVIAYGRRPYVDVTIVDAATGTARTVPPPPDRLFGPQVAVLGDDVLVLGARIPDGAVVPATEVRPPAPGPAVVVPGVAPPAGPPPGPLPPGVTIVPAPPGGAPPSDTVRPPAAPATGAAEPSSAAEPRAGAEPPRLPGLVQWDCVLAVRPDDGTSREVWCGDVDLTTWLTPGATSVSWPASPPAECAAWLRLSAAEPAPQPATVPDALCGARELVELGGWHAAVVAGDALVAASGDRRVRLGRANTVVPCGEHLYWTAAGDTDRDALVLRWRPGAGHREIVLRQLPAPGASIGDVRCVDGAAAVAVRGARGGLRTVEVRAVARA